MSVLNDVRSKLATNNVNELMVVEKQPALLEIWKEIQLLREEMNIAKKNASDKVSEPYLDIISELEKRYALLLKLSA